MNLQHTIGSCEIGRADMFVTGSAPMPAAFNVHVCFPLATQVMYCERTENSISMTLESRRTRHSQHCQPRILVDIRLRKWKNILHLSRNNLGL